MKNLQLYNADNLEVMATLADESIDVICIDPPYLYLKNQKLERPFDEPKFFAECKRLLTKKGFIVLFGRGTSFYRWNTILDGLGLVFKEEIIWNKKRSTTPTLAVGRRHETISIYSEKGSLNRCKMPYIEKKKYNIDSLASDIKVIKSAIKNSDKLDKILRYLEGDTSLLHLKKFRKHKWETGIKGNTLLENDRMLVLVKSIVEGANEESIMIEGLDAYRSSIHPTQKPVRLLERLLALVIPKDKPRNEVVVADFFAGSMSCMEAVHNMGMKGIATEIDQEYFEAGKQRIDKLQPLIINH